MLRKTYHSLLLALCLCVLNVSPLFAQDVTKCGDRLTKLILRVSKSVGEHAARAREECEQKSAYEVREQWKVFLKDHFEDFSPVVMAEFESAYAEEKQGLPKRKEPCNVQEYEIHDNRMQREMALLLERQAKCDTPPNMEAMARIQETKDKKKAQQCQIKLRMDLLARKVHEFAKVTAEIVQCEGNHVKEPFTDYWRSYVYPYSHMSVTSSTHLFTKTLEKELRSRIAQNLECDNLKAREMLEKLRYDFAAEYAACYPKTEGDEALPLPSP